MKNKLLKVLVVLLVATSLLTACGGSENTTNSGAGTHVEGNIGGSNNGQANQPQYIELSEEEKVSLEMMAQFITATRWGEELWGKTTTPTDETICNFINRIASENQYHKEGAYNRFLPSLFTGGFYHEYLSHPR